MDSNKEHNVAELEKVPVLVYTDDGRDVDDALAMAYLAGSDNIEMVGLVTTHMIPDRRALIARVFLSNLGNPDVPIGVGSIFTTGKEDPILIKYLREHTIRGRTYEGDGLIECFPDGVEMLVDTIRRYGKDLKVAALAPLTDLAKAANEDPDAFRKIGGIYLQGQATVENGRLEPDSIAYNCAEDMEAAYRVLDFQDDVPFTLVGKHTAYQTPFTRTDFARFASTGNPSGQFLEKHAINGITCFSERAPEIFARVFGVPADQIEQLAELSKPYDETVVKAIANPTGFVARRVGHHSLIGMTAEDHGVQDPVALKAELIDVIMGALTANNR